MLERIHEKIRSAMVRVSICAIVSSGLVFARGNLPDAGRGNEAIVTVAMQTVCDLQMIGLSAVEARIQLHIAELIQWIRNFN
jgi:hypothetical protein